MQYGTTIWNNKRFCLNQHSQTADI